MNMKEYFKEAFLLDLKAGFITGIVALPLAIAFAIASGVSPIMGLYTAIIAGILGSLFGGSVFSITGPTGAMTIIILSTVNKYGIEGLLLAGFLAGVIQLLLGLIRLGSLVKYIPLPIVSGFTAGIGVIILIGQIPNFLGISIPAQEHVWDTFIELFKSIGLVNMLAVAIAIGTLLILIFSPKLFAKTRYLRSVPPSLIALILATVLVVVLGLQVPQVGSIPSGFPEFHLFKINFELVKAVLPAAFTIALLGAIEALLCAVVSDGMTSTKHDSNKELRAQGMTNMVVPFFGGIPATAAIARTAVNIREGAKTRMAGVYHALILLLIVLFFGGVAQYIPKAFLAGVLMYVAYRMINFTEFRTIIKISSSEAIVLFVTFALTVFTDLVFAVQIGMLLAIGLLFIRFTNLLDIKYMEEYDPNNEITKHVSKSKRLKENISIYTMNGPFFFGAMNVFDKKLSEHIQIKKPYIVIRMKHVPMIDSSGVARLNAFIKERKKAKCHVFLATLNPKVKEILYADEEFNHLMHDKKEYIFETTEDAVNHIEKKYLQEKSLSIRSH